MRVASAVFAVVCLAAPARPDALQSAAGPTYVLRHVLDIGAPAGTRVVELDGNRTYVVSDAGLHPIDLTAGTIGEPVSRLRFGRPFVFAPDIGRVFAILESNELVVLDASTFEQIRSVKVPDSSHVVYDAARKELYLFSYRATRVEVSDALTGASTARIPLPTWGANGQPLAPGRILISMRDEYAILDTESRQLTPLPLPRNIGSLRLFSDEEGVTLFATTEKQLLAFDAFTGAVVGVVNAGERPSAAYDPVAEVVLATVRPLGADLYRLVVFRHDARGFTQISEQELPGHGQGVPRPTRTGFTNVGAGAEVDVEPRPILRRAKLLIWDRVGG